MESGRSYKPAACWPVGKRLTAVALGPPVGIGRFRMPNFDFSVPGLRQPADFHRASKAAPMPSASTGKDRLGATAQPSPGAGSCRDAYMMDMHVDVHVGKRTQHATRSIAFDQAQFGQHLNIFVHALDVAAGAPGQVRAPPSPPAVARRLPTPSDAQSACRRTRPGFRSSASRPGSCRPAPPCPLAAGLRASRATW